MNRKSVGPAQEARGDSRHFMCKRGAKPSHMVLTGLIAVFLTGFGCGLQQSGGSQSERLSSMEQALTCNQCCTSACVEWGGMALCTGLIGGCDVDNGTGPQFPIPCCSLADVEAPEDVQTGDPTDDDPQEAPVIAWGESGPGASQCDECNACERTCRNEHRNASTSCYDRMRACTVKTSKATPGGTYDKCHNAYYDCEQQALNASRDCLKKCPCSLTCRLGCPSC